MLHMSPPFWFYQSYIFQQSIPASTTPSLLSPFIASPPPIFDNHIACSRVICSVLSISPCATMNSIHSIHPLFLLLWYTFNYVGSLGVIGNARCWSPLFFVYHLLQIIKINLFNLILNNRQRRPISRFPPMRVRPVWSTLNLPRRRLHVFKFRDRP